MAISTCVKCDGKRFEVKEASLTGSNFKYYFVQCASCGGVVGVTEFYNIGALLKKVASKLGVSVT
jgi:predicted nucleic-acid-binding Zn-ribbon protein